jgi:glucose/mannose-6-phosphate isomerase
MEFPLSFQQIQRLDSSDMLSLLTSFADQLGEAMEIMGQVCLTTNEWELHNVLVTGMGGSAIGGDLLRDYLVDAVDLPIMVNRGYDLPRFVGPSTLVFASSYSGDTEETLAACREALQRKSRIIAICSGGELARLASQEGFPLIQIPGGYPPRAALGYSFVALLMSLSKMGLVGDQEEDLRETQELIRRRAVEYGLAIPLAENLAKEVALKLHGKLPIIYAWAGRLEAVAIRWRGQLAENSKQLSSHHLLPEMNHNEIVGWGAPRALGNENVVVVLLRDREEPRSIGKRTEITKELIAPSVAEIVEIWTTGTSLLARLFSLLYLGDFVSFYLAALNGVDPTPVGRIEELKKRLGGGS